MEEPPAAKLRSIAFYLPQFHSCRENDEWWGKGFTDWTNVARARPLFPGHYQPHLPADLGFYDLRVPEVREQQASLAKAHGISGFCYYHYWFMGRTILERPFNEVLATGRPDLPFCLCWANESWTRAWDGRQRQILLRQDYSHEDDRAHIRSLIPAFRDPRYLRVRGKPLFLVYRTESLPEPARTAAIWREEAIRSGLGEIYLARVESFVPGIDPRTIGFDAAVEFAPDWRRVGQYLYRTAMLRSFIKLGVLPDAYIKHKVTRYDDLVSRMLSKPATDYVWFRCATPGFDNSARRSEGSTIFIKNTPAKYERWLTQIADITLRERDGDERIVFLNAWNEWGEGNHLEPDAKFGLGFLEATRRALATVRETSEQAQALAMPGYRNHRTSQAVPVGDTDSQSKQ